MMKNCTATTPRRETKEGDAGFQPNCSGYRREELAKVPEGKFLFEPPARSNSLLDLLREAVAILRCRLIVLAKSW
jgi:hypothetical protein